MANHYLLLEWGGYAHLFFCFYFSDMKSFSLLVQWCVLSDLVFSVQCASNYSPSMDILLQFSFVRKNIFFQTLFWANCSFYFFSPHQLSMPSPKQIMVTHKCNILIVRGRKWRKYDQFGIAHAIGLSCASHAGDLGSYLGGELSQVTPMREEEITNCKSHVAPVSLTNWYIMIKYFVRIRLICIIIIITMQINLILTKTLIVITMPNIELVLFSDGLNDVHACKH